MRLNRLDLIRYGLFTGRSLPFRPDARVHVVFGGNEAGKSTALAAIGDLLYGFPNVTPYNFLHEKDLRVGAEIVARDGRTLEFKRLKGRGVKKTLLGADDAVLPDDALVPFLGTVQQDLFRQAFGLSTATLRAGARSLITDKGELGAALIGAASGLGDLQKLRERLEKKADELVGSRAAAGRAFWEAKKKFEAARKEESDRSLTAIRWKKLTEALDKLTGRIAGIDSRLNEMTRRRTRLERLKSAAPLVRLIDGCQEAVAALGHLPEVDDDFPDRLAAALKTCADTDAARIAAHTALEAAREDVAAIVPDTAALEAGAAIGALVVDLGAEKDARDKLARDEASYQRAKRKLEELARRLGLEDMADLIARRPVDAQMARMADLVQEGWEIESRYRKATEDRRKEEEALTELQRQRGDDRSLVDPAPLRADFAVFTADLSALAALADLRREINVESARLAEEAARLSPPCPNLDLLAATPRPSETTVARFARDFEELTAERRRAEAEVGQARAKVEALQADLGRLSIGGDVPTPEALAAARASRGAAWDLVRTALFAEVRATPVELVTEVAALETAIALADSLADAAIRNGDRMGQIAVKSHDLRTQQAAMQAAADLLAHAGEALASHTEIWVGVWGDLGITPLPPAEMATWLLKVENLLQRRAPLEDKRARLEDLEARARALVTPLADLAGRLRIEVLDGMEAPALAMRIRSRIDEIAAAWDDVRNLDARIEDCKLRVDKAVTNWLHVKDDYDAWQPQFDEALGPIGLPRGSSRAEAEAAIAIWKDVPGAMEQLADAARNRDEVQATIDRFAGRTRALVGELAPNLVDLAPAQAVAALRLRLQEAQAIEMRRQNAIRLLDRAERAAETSASAALQAENDLARLQISAGLEADVDLPALLGQLTERRRLLEQWQAHRKLLADQSPGESEAELRAELVGFDFETAEVEIETLERERKDLTGERDTCVEERRRAHDTLEALETGNSAEQALQQKASAEADMAATVRDWIVLKLAAKLVAEATARHRAGRHVPLLERAGSLFAILTGGSFTGIEPREDIEDGRMHIVGLRPGGEAVEIASVDAGAEGKAGATTGGLSEGTLDQLYLAMRLAHLEDFARSAEPLPFIGDDLFMTFDDTRTGLGLDALADMSTLIQPIVFTHHRRVAEMAKSRLGDAADVIEL